MEGHDQPMEQYMKHFFIRHLPPRPDVARTMTATEAALMEQRAAYWKALHDAREVVAYELGVVAIRRTSMGIMCEKCIQKAINPKGVGSA